jgi:hypothetical protein
MQLKTGRGVRGTRSTWRAWRAWRPSGWRRSRHHETQLHPCLAHASCRLVLQPLLPAPLRRTQSCEAPPPTLAAESLGQHRCRRCHAVLRGWRLRTPHPPRAAWRACAAPYRCPRRSVPRNRPVQGRPRPRDVMALPRRKMGSCASLARPSARSLLRRLPARQSPWKRDRKC